MKLVITQNITLDGVVEAVTDWFAPQDGADDTSDIQAQVVQLMAAEEAQLLGRVTFEEFRGYWPKQTNDTTGISAHLDQVRKYVVSRTLSDANWQNTTILSASPVDAAKELRAQPGGNLGVTGSIRLCHALIDAGLVDEYRLFLYPVVLGRGRRLFRDGMQQIDGLSLSTVKRFSSGIALLTYVRK